MENSSTNTIEKQIDNFLEHFKRSASKAMEADWCNIGGYSDGASCGDGISAPTTNIDTIKLQTLNNNNNSTSLQNNSNGYCMSEIPLEANVPIISKTEIPATIMKTTTTSSTPIIITTSTTTATAGAAVTVSEFVATVVPKRRLLKQAASQISLMEKHQNLLQRPRSRSSCLDVTDLMKVLDKAAETVLADIQTNADQLNEQVEFEQQVQTRQQSLSQSKNQSHQQQSMLESQCSVNSTTSIKTIQQQSITHQKNKQQLINTNTNNNNNSSNNNNNSSSNNNNSNNNNNNKTDNYTNQIRIDSIVGAATTIVISATQPPLPPLPPSTTTASTTPKHTINNVNVNDVGHVAQQYHHQQFQQTIETATIATATATATTTTSQSTLNSSNNSLYFNNSQVISCALEVLPDNLLLLRHPSDSVNSLLEHIAPVNMSSEGILNIADVANLLHPQHAIITGGRSLEGCPLIVFPDNNCFNMLEEVDYQKLILYLTSVPSLQDADLGFHLIIDRRKDKWASVKTVLQRISVYFPGIIHVVYVLRPCGLFQKAISEVSTKFSKDEYRFRLITCSTLNDLHEYIDGSQLTSDMGGTLIYSHNEWIQQRISLENFSSLTHQVSADLDTFIQAVHDTEFPNSVEATQKLLDDQGGDYEKLKYEILAATKHGENLLNNIKLNDEVKEISERAGHVSSIERLLVQLEETERRFDEFWQTHYNRLQQCLELRKFESGFRELQHTFDGHLKSLSDTLEIGTSVVRVDELLDEMKTFEQQCQYDVEKTKAIIEVGQQLIVSRGVYPWEIVQPKCDELQRVCNIIEERLKKRHETLCKNRELMETIDKANVWCMNGEKLLTAKPIEKCSIALELIEENVQEIETFLASANEFKLPSPDEFNKIFFESTTAEIKALLSEIHQKIDDVSLRCDKRIANLKKLLLEAPRPMQTPEKTVPLQPPGGAPNLLRRKHKTDIIHELRPRSVDGIVDTGNTAINGDNNYCHLDNGDRVRNQQDLESRRQTRGHILNELLETERIYVHEINSIIKGYCDQMHSEEMKHLVPASLHGKEDILFGNLHEIYTFHNDVFLKDLENCISTTELVALCFVQRRDTFYRLYSFYCQNVPRSDHLRETLVDTHLFLQECQKRLGHRLSLGAYLLKPVQRISKYQLLLKDLLRHSDSGNCTKELQKALDCMLIVLKCVNDSMHQVAISGFPADLAQQGELLLQDSFQVWSDSKKDIRLRLKPRQRYIFLYQKSMLFCKQTSKAGHDKTTYQFKHYLKMSQIGLTESVRGDSSRFEVWLQGRQEVHTLQAHNLDIKNKWVAEIKRVLFNQLEELKGEKIKQYGSNFRGLRQTTSWDTPNILLIGNNMSQRSTISTDASSESSNRNSNCSSSDDNYPIFNSNCGNSTSNLSSNPSNCTSRSTDKEHADKEACGWSSDYSNSEDEMSTMVDNNITTPRFKNFLIPWSSHHHHQHNRGTLATNTHLQHEYHQNQSQQQQHHHHRNQNNYDHHYSCKRESQQKSSHNTQNNCLLHSQRNNNKSNSKFYVPVEH